MIIHSSIKLCYFMSVYLWWKKTLLCSIFYSERTIYKHRLLQFIFVSNIIMINYIVIINEHSVLSKKGSIQRWKIYNVQLRNDIYVHINDITEFTNIFLPVISLANLDGLPKATIVIILITPLVLYKSNYWPCDK